MRLGKALAYGAMPRAALAIRWGASRDRRERFAELCFAARAVSFAQGMANGKGAWKESHRNANPTEGDS